jgi:hypothetical protein
LVINHHHHHHHHHLLLRRLHKLFFSELFGQKIRVGALDKRASAVLLLHHRVVTHFARSVGGEGERLNPGRFGVAVVLPAQQNITALP